MPSLLFTFIISLFLTPFIFTTPSNAAYNVVSFGAKSGAQTDSTQAFLKAWAAACRSATASTIYVPKGSFLVKAAVFSGPCKSTIKIMIDGTIVAPDYRSMGNSGYWILFIEVDRVAIFGGTLDAKGAAYWACRRSGKSCPVGARSITFNWASNIVVSGLTSINSQLSHVVINSCKNVAVRNVKIIAPDQSPNTDGIHVQGSTGVTITGSTIGTGDDCISIGPGTRNLWMEHIKCGPGHGISIGSLGKDKKEDGVQNVTVANSVFIGSDNGVRIKSWARPSNSFVTNIMFRNIIMTRVQYPIIVDQNYCPDNQGCPNQSSGVKVSQVTYRNIKGTSRSQAAMIFNCSSSNPCRGIRLQDINLTYMNKAATSTCRNVHGTRSGVVVPQSCV
ncbi:hypothetical protein PVL29_006949 [Vitis rotundifolia]|uniref:Polygalacturonase n=1 Tax=Vitis rotundifolia TaxID=103349 RepID=A0AA39A6B1_VITRO|nr:hypothetical protein PVL29_006949 [Vitis rotundifolia]